MKEILLCYYIIAGIVVITRKTTKQRLLMLKFMLVGGLVAVVATTLIIAITTALGAMLIAFTSIGDEVLFSMAPLLIAAAVTVLAAVGAAILQFFCTGWGNVFTQAKPMLILSTVSILIGAALHLR